MDGWRGGWAVLPVPTRTLTVILLQLFLSLLLSYGSGADVYICGSDGSVKYVSKKRHYCVQSEHYIPAQIEASNSAIKSNASLQHSGQA